MCKVRVHVRDRKVLEGTKVHVTTAQVIQGSKYRNETGMRERISGTVV